MPPDAFAPPLPANDVAPSDAAPSAAEDAVFQSAAASDIQDVIDFPCRTLEVEYKSWRNLDHAEDRAELARDIAALANHGGGYIVFGFHEPTLAPDDTDPFVTNCTVERIAAIVRTYLDPPVACEVARPVSSLGIVHPVVRVPGHGALPVGIRQDGPLTGGTRLVERGTYYIRKHAPAPLHLPISLSWPRSSKIEGPQDWAPLIRRCVRRDREALLGQIEAAIEGRVGPPDPVRRLLTWHRAARAAFLALTPRSPVAETLVRRHYAFTYAFELIRPEMLEHAQLAERLRRTVFDVQTQFRSGWNMFDPPYRRGVQARFVQDPACGDDETDFLETAWLRARDPGETADFWRVSPSGLATIIRGYAEDMAQPAAARPVRPGTCLSPENLAQEVAELVCHARAFARMFAGVRRVTFRCEWWGLDGRELFDPDSRWPYRGPALVEHRATTLQIPLAHLTEAWPEAVAHLIAPVLRAIEPELSLDAEWVRKQATYWATPPG
jgi:hypothetical protein